jgi:hypothetical protein
MDRVLDGEPAGFGHPPQRGGHSGGVHATGTVQDAHLMNHRPLHPVVLPLSAGVDVTQQRGRAEETLGPVALPAAR